MKKFFVLLVLVVSLLAMMGCSNGLSGEVKETQKPENSESDGSLAIGIEDLTQDLQSAIKKFGNVNNIYPARANGRFCTSDVVTQDHFGMKLYFEAYLIEFNDLNSDIAGYLNYLEKNSLIENNALLNQDYPNFEYMDNKKYVEFACFKIYKENCLPKDMKVFLYETRTFYGDYIKQVIEQGTKDISGNYNWYATSVLFDPTMTIDYNRNRYIDDLDGHRERPNYSYEFKTKKIDINNVPDSRLNDFGKIKNIYQNEYDGSSTDFYLIEYENNDSPLKDYVEYYNGNSGKESLAIQDYKNPDTQEPIVYNPNNLYIEYYKQTKKDYEEFSKPKIWLREKTNSGNYTCVVNEEDFANIKTFRKEIIESEDSEIRDLFGVLGTNFKIYKNNYYQDNTNIENKYKDVYFIAFQEPISCKEKFKDQFRKSNYYYGETLKQTYKVNNISLPKLEEGKYFECEKTEITGTYKIRTMLNMETKYYAYEKDFTKNDFAKLNLNLKDIEAGFGEGITWTNNKSGDEEVIIRLESYSLKKIYYKYKGIEYNKSYTLEGDKYFFNCGEHIIFVPELNKETINVKFSTDETNIITLTKVK